MQHEKSCGAIVYRKSHGNTEILLIKHINSGHWSFPKGHMEDGETEIETAIREIKEETSVNVMIDPTFRETVSYFPSGIPKRPWSILSHGQRITTLCRRKKKLQRSAG